MSTEKLLVVSLILSAFASPIFVLKAHGSSEDVSALDISQAEQTLASAYEAVLEAERAGANVSRLLANLTVAGKYLANAHIWYKLGDYDNASRFAKDCYEIGREVRNEVVGEKNEAYSLWVTDHVVRMTGSIIGVVIIVLLSFLGWHAFKRWYHKRILGMKPEVGSGES